MPASGIKTALTAAGILASGPISDTLNSLALNNLCLGITVPPDGLDATLTRAQMSGS